LLGMLESYAAATSPGAQQVPMATLPFSAEVAAGLKPAPTSVGSTTAAAGGGPMDVMSMMQDAERRMRKDMEAQVCVCVCVCVWIFSALMATAEVGARLRQLGRSRFGGFNAEPCDI
jgi:hypothetical protein